MFESRGHGNQGGFVSARSPPHNQAHVIAFLSKPVSAIVEDPGDAAWLAKLECRSVLDVALLIQHVYSDDADLDRWFRIFRVVDRGVGGLPMGELTVDELQTIRRAAAQACEEETATKAAL